MKLTSTSPKGVKELTTQDEIIEALDHHFRRETWVASLNRGYTAFLWKGRYTGIKVDKVANEQ